jgi:hypothetical protein
MSLPPPLKKKKLFIELLLNEGVLEGLGNILLEMCFKNTKGEKNTIFGTEVILDGNWIINLRF